MRALDANIGDRVTYMKWYVDANNSMGRLGTVTGFDESSRECTYVEVKWDDGQESSLQEDALKRVKA